MSVALADHPNHVAERLMGRDYISYSAVSTFQSCPLKFYFKYCLGLPEQIVSASLVFGGAIHSAIELHFIELLAGNPAPSLGELMAAYHEAWQARDPASIRFGKEDDTNSLARVAERMLAAFQASQLAQPNGTIIGIEEELAGEIVDGCPELLARVDLVVDAGDALVITDYKTSRRGWSTDQLADSSGQLLLYHELARQLANHGKPIRLEFAVITKTKNVAIESYPVYPDVEQLDRTKRVVERVWHAMQAEHFYPSPSPMHCPTCPFRDPCRAWAG